MEYKDLPLEYKLLDYKPEEWTVLKTFILMEYMSDMLSRGNSDIEDTYLINEIGKNSYDNLFPEYFEEVKPIIPDYIDFDFKNKKDIYITISISEGNLYQFGNITAYGLDDFDSTIFKNLLDINLRPGSSFSRAKLENTKENINK